MNWQPIETAPMDTPVRVKVGRGMTFIARRWLDSAIYESYLPCVRWVAEYEGEHPPCWSNGACWESNEDEVASLQPTGWMPLSGAHSTGGGDA